MKKLYFFLFLSLVAMVYGQEKYALVIGNSHYTNFGTLQNPVNDASDMADVLTSLGFKVELLKDATLTQMENSAIGLKNRLSEAGNDSIGFFYYAGHGLEMDGANYLIPVNANIPDRYFLRERAFSVQVMLDMLNDSRDALNIVVLDACRDFPASWSRSLDRGLAIIANPPANHIIMYATGAGKIANDGSGRNGLFTSYLLDNLKQPNDVNEIFRKTMVDVANASNNEQRPALYTDFGKIVYFNSAPVLAQDTKQSVPVQQAVSLNPESAPRKLEKYLYQIPSGFGPDRNFFTSEKNRQNIILDAENAGLSEIKVRLANGDDPYTIHPDLLQGIQSELNKQKVSYSVGMGTFIAGLVLMVSSLIDPIKTMAPDKQMNMPLFGTLLGGGAALTFGTLIIVPIGYNKRVAKIANMRAQASYIETNIAGN